MKTIFISKGQYLSDIINEFVTNTIYFKTLPNIGATRLELMSKRNSIVIEPNVPVIKGKKAKGILSIYEKVGIDEIINYLLSNQRYKKILVTPESFYKLLMAAKMLDIDLKKDYFLLFDECDRTIKDVAFRPKVLFPMDSFFHFENKAFISATAIQPSDPRFLEQGFSSVHIKPDYVVEKPISLVSTNNVYLALKQKLSETQNENVCIFINSTNLIGSIIKSLSLNEESAVFCSRESAQQLALSGIKNVYDNLAAFKKYNFFTSRFFSAVDIFMDTDPSIIIITDLKIAIHTMIDPYCDTTQIIGRFRNGHADVTHISTFDQDLKSMSSSEVIAYLNGCENSYKDIKALHAATLNQGSKDTLESALNLVPFAMFLNKDGSKNHYMVDNMVLEEKVKHSYINHNNFVQDYTDLGYSPTLINMPFPLSGGEQLKVKAGIITLDVVKSVIDAIRVANDSSSMFTLFSKQEVLAELEKSHPLIMEGYRILGSESLLKNGYSKKQIKKAIEAKVKRNDCEHFGFLTYLQSKIIDGEIYTALELYEIFEQGIHDHSLSIKPKLSIIKDIFNLKRRSSRKSGKEEKVYFVVGCRLNR